MDQAENTYDSEAETREHIRQVAERLKHFWIELRDRGERHDLSKLGPIEKPIFDAVTPKLKGLEYGTDEYRQSLKDLGPALAHHYAHNSHHPEHWGDGLAGMDLLDLVEMYCDWAAATLRTKDGDMSKGIEINVKRFEIDPMLAQILRNTWQRHGGFTGYHNYHLNGQFPDDDGSWTEEHVLGTGQVYRRQPKPNHAIPDKENALKELASISQSMGAYDHTRGTP